VVCDVSLAAAAVFVGAHAVGTVGLDNDVLDAMTTAASTVDVVTSLANAGAGAATEVLAVHSFDDHTWKSASISILVRQFALSSCAAWTLDLPD